MNKYKTLLAFFLAFLSIVFILEMFGVFDLPNEEILSFIFIFVGFGAVYISFGKNSKGILFTGTALFLIGIILFAQGNYEISTPSRIMLPAVLFILGSGFLMLFIDDSSSKLILILSVIFFVLGTTSAFFIGELNLQSFFILIPDIIIKYFPIIILMLGIVLILSKEN